mgnify:CR=1 FL=1
MNGVGRSRELAAHTTVWMLWPVCAFEHDGLAAARGSWSYTIYCAEAGALFGLILPLVAIATTRSEEPRSSGSTCTSLGGAAKIVRREQCAGARINYRTLQELFHDQISQDYSSNYALYSTPSPLPLRT